MRIVSKLDEIIADFLSELGTLCQKYSKRFIIEANVKTPYVMIGIIEQIKAKILEDFKLLLETIEE